MGLECQIKFCAEFIFIKSTQPEIKFNKSPIHEIPELLQKKRFFEKTVVMNL